MYMQIPINKVIDRAVTSSILDVDIIISIVNRTQGKPTKTRRPFTSQNYPLPSKFCDPSPLQTEEKENEIKKKNTRHQQLLVQSR